jgi:hypothetical protein
MLGEMNTAFTSQSTLSETTLRNEGLLEKLVMCQRVFYGCLSSISFPEKPINGSYPEPDESSLYFDR